MPASRQAQPVVSVLFALFDVRGDPTAHLRSWAQEQTLPRERCQVVVASAADDPAGEAEVEALLAPHDVFVRAPGVSELGLYDVAAQQATAPWIFVTEAHCLGEPDCLAAVLRTIEADPDLDVVTVEIPRVASNYAGRLGARWFGHVYEQWSALDWKVLPLAGFAVRGEAYRRAGGLDARYGLFAPPALSARLDEQGAKIGSAADARVVHVQPETIEEHHEHSVHFTEGACDFRAEHDPVFCERYFGHPQTWGNRLGFRPEVARPVARGLLGAARGAIARRSDDAWWMLRELGARLPTATAGVRPHLLRDALAFNAGEQLLRRLPLPEDRLYPWYLRAQDRVVRLTELRWIRDHVGPPTPPLRTTGSWSAEAVDGGELVGAHGLEYHDGRSFRWTEPVALLRLAPPPGEHLLTIDTGSLRGSPLDYVCAVYAGAHPLPPGDMQDEDGRLMVRLSPDFAEQAAANGVSLLARPLEPGRQGSPDRRRLGMPVFSIELRPAS
jgi:hypothetical protein